MKVNELFIFLGSDSIFARRTKRSRKLEEGFSKKNKDVRVCIKTRKVCVPHFLTWMKYNNIIVFHTTIIMYLFETSLKDNKTVPKIQDDYFDLILM